MRNQLTKRPQGQLQNATPQHSNTSVLASSLGHPSPHLLMGNHTVLRQLSSSRLQAKLTVSHPDMYEQEADRVVEQVMRMPEPAVGAVAESVNIGTTSSLQRKCSCGGSAQSGECDECRQKWEGVVQ